MTNYTFSQVCKAAGKDPFYIKNIQRALDLPIPEKNESYSKSYVEFLTTIISLRAFSVPLKKITELFELEKKILVLLHVDALTDSKTWYLDACGRNNNSGHPENQLLLTEYDLGFPVTAEHVQHNLDFGERDKELFKGIEMGEDVRNVLSKYLDMVHEIRKKMRQEEIVLVNALDWAEKIGDKPYLKR